MREHKYNITFNVRNITLNLENTISFFRNLIGHFTGKQKIITLSFIILILSLVNIINTFTYTLNISALDYSSNIGIGFTFNPTLSIRLSSSDLIIDNLKPGTAEDSNSINVSIATNAAYGYTLSVNVNDEDLVHSNNIDTFSSIDTNADLESLSVDNTWGYTSKLNNETIWNNYNGLSSSSNAILLDNNNIADSTGGIDFKIAAKASNTQPSGEYTGTINFIAVTKVAPMSLLDSFIASGVEQLNGYYKMQDMTHDICEAVDIEESELQLIDVRDNKVYWVAKLKDGNCWMTQNLDLDLDSNRTYTHWDTDLGQETLNESATWRPINSTASVDNWTNDDTEPHSADPGDIYYYTSNSKINDIKYTTLQNCKDAGHNDCAHYHVGNYYNWSVAVADNDTSELISGNAPNSICSSGWRLPNIANKDFRNLLGKYGIQTGDSAVNIRKEPLYLTRSGQVTINQRAAGYYWSNTTYRDGLSYDLFFDNTYIYPDNGGNKSLGISLRCLSR